MADLVSNEDGSRPPPNQKEEEAEEEDLVGRGIEFSKIKIQTEKVDEIEKPRLPAVVSSPEVQSFLRNMLETRLYTFSPTLSFESGVTYPEASKFFGGKKKDKEVNDFLLDLYNGGLVQRKIVDRIITCSSCDSSTVYSRYECPRCHSFDVATFDIVEHRLCGYIGPKTSFFISEKARRESSAKEVEGKSSKLVPPPSLICPQCKQQITTEKDYKVLGKTFGCQNCNSRFEAPPIVHKCADCKRLFSYAEAVYSPVYEYAISPSSKELYSSGLLSIGPVIEYLRSQGYGIESPKEIVGVSESAHRFDIVASIGKLRNVLLGDFCLAPSDQVVISSFAKRYDVNPYAKSFLITYTDATPHTESLAKIYGISILYVGSDKEISLQEQLSVLLSGTPQTIASSKNIPPPMRSSALSKINYDLEKPVKNKVEEEDDDDKENKTNTLPEVVEEKIPVLAPQPPIVTTTPKRKSSASKKKKSATGIINKNRKVVEEEEASAIKSKEEHDKESKSDEIFWFSNTADDDDDTTLLSLS